MKTFKPFNEINKVGESVCESPKYQPQTLRKIIFWLTKDYKKKVDEYNETREKIVSLRDSISLFSKYKNTLFYWISCQELKEEKVRLKALHKSLENYKFQLKYHCDLYSRIMNRKD